MTHSLWPAWLTMPVLFGVLLVLAVAITAMLWLVQALAAALLGHPTWQDRIAMRRRQRRQQRDDRRRAQR